MALQMSSLLLLLSFHKLNPVNSVPDSTFLVICEIVDLSFAVDTHAVPIQRPLSMIFVGNVSIINL